MPLSRVQKEKQIVLLSPLLRSHPLISDLHLADSCGVDFGFTHLHQFDWLAENTKVLMDIMWKRINLTNNSHWVMVLLLVWGSSIITRCIVVKRETYEADLLMIVIHITWITFYTSQFWYFSSGAWCWWNYRIDQSEWWHLNYIQCHVSVSQCAKYRRIYKMSSYHFARSVRRKRLLKVKFYKGISNVWLKSIIIIIFNIW